MANWIQPLEFEKWIVNAFAGSPSMFVSISLFILSALGAYFRMTGFIFAFGIGLFVMMFSNLIPMEITFFIAIIAGLSAGFIVSKLFDR